MRAIHLGLIYVFGLIGTLLLNGCNFSGSPSDESDLQQVVNYYYQPGKSDNLTNDIRYKFLSEKSRAQESLEDWGKSTDASIPNTTTAVSLLGPQNSNGQTLEVVSITRAIPNEDGKKIKKIDSNTWMIENGKWRRLFFLKTQSDFENALKAGDYETAQTKTAEWLALDPDSIEAYRNMGLVANHPMTVSSAASTYSTDFNARPLNIVDQDGTTQVYFIDTTNSDYEPSTDEALAASPAVKMDDIVNHMIAINPYDDRTLFCVSNWVPTPGIVRNYFTQWYGAVTDPDEVFNIASNIHDMDFRFAFLQQKKDTPGVLLLKLEAFAVRAESEHSVFRWDLYRNFATGDGQFEHIKPALDNMGSLEAANRAGKLGELLFSLKDYDYAQQLLAYGSQRGPNELQIRALGQDVAGLKK